MGGGGGGGGGEGEREEWREGDKGGSDEGRLEWGQERKDETKEGGRDSYTCSSPPATLKRTPTALEMSVLSLVT